MREFFEGIAADIPNILWDGFRNGLTHMLMPKTQAMGGHQCFFRVMSQSPEPAEVVHSGTNYAIELNVWDLLDQLEGAVSRYKERLEADEKLQAKFRTVWEAGESLRVPATKYSDSEMRALGAVPDGSRTNLFDRQ
ncbi:MAG: hypothetical protein ABFE08_02040 [Armatimonadia bacterium]